MIEIACPVCRSTVRVMDDMAGRNVSCPGCGEAVMVPASSTARSSTPRSATTSELGTLRRSAAPSESATNDPDATQDLVRRNDDTMGESDPAEFLGPPESADEIGRLGSYRVLKVLGQGGMGTVFLAEDVQLQRHVALKTMLPSVAAVANAKKRFLREARAAAAIEHEHIIAIHQVGEDRGVPYLAMPLLKGQPLDACLKSRSALPVAEAVRIGREIAEGLAAAHERGLIHRDIKPGNIWLEGDKRKVKILDFGLARGSSESSELSHLGAVVGTPAYMAPEQARGEAVDARADLFSLGCVLYETLTGRRPFPGKDAIAILSSLANHAPKPPHEVNPDVSLAMSNLVMTLLAKNPDDRYPSAVAVVEAFRQAEADPGGADPGGAVSAPKTERPRRRWPAIMAALLALLPIGWIAGQYLLHDRTEVATEPVRVVKDDADEPRPRFALRFDGQESHVVFPTLIGEDDAPSTIEGWILNEPSELRIALKTPKRVRQIFRTGTEFRVIEIENKGGQGRYFTCDGKPGRWSHFAAVQEGSATNFFFDGKRMTTGLNTKAVLPRSEIWPTFAGHLGRQPKSTATFGGSLAGLRYSKSARYHADFTPPRTFDADADTIALYRFDEGKGSNLNDSSGHGHHGEILRAKWTPMTDSGADR